MLATKESDMLQDLFEAYGEAEQIQDPKESLTDSQLKSLSLAIEELVQNKSQGTIIDIGCGKGALLPKLAHSTSFLSNTAWFYLGADFVDLHDYMLQLAASLRLHRRCEVIEIDTLYDSWIDSINVPFPLLIFVRNVLHELDIPKTAKLLHLLNNHMTMEDTLLIQDLLVFPKSERGNVCWDFTCLCNLFKRVGFDPILTTEKSRSGAQWVSAKLVKAFDSKKLKIDDVTTIVAEERLTQLLKWRSAEILPNDTRVDKIAKIDFDLQIAALYKQLDRGGFLNPSQQKDKPLLNPNDAFQLALKSYDPYILDRDKFQLPSISNFRDRANSQDSLEIFLSSKDSVVVIQGGVCCGKTALVAHVLSRRAHGRSIIPIDCEIASDVWPILEQYLLAIGCRSSVEILTNEKTLTFDNMKGALSIFIENVASKSVVVFDHFEKFLDPNGQVMDVEIRQFLSMITSANNAKVVITTRREPLLHFLPEFVGINEDQPPVGRFPEGPHVKNLLDDYVDRTAIGIEEYPEDLMVAIDRFPYLATLAGKLIAENGIDATQDPMILKIIKSYLYDELAMRIMTKEARPALNLARILRIPTPQYLFEITVGKESTSAAMETGLLYHVSDRYRNDLLSCASILRDLDSEINTMEDDTNEELQQEEIHMKIAKNYEIISYESQGDPRWIREAHYHYLAAGKIEDPSDFGSIYKGELYWAGRTWFRRYRKYNEALEVLRAAETMGLKTYELRMLIAACLVRLKKREKGEECYKDLISEFPNQVGIKTSYVDSLLSISEFDDALALLNEFGFSMYESSPWIIGQYGRAYLGKQEYFKAIEAFTLQLHKDRNSPAVVYVRLAQAHFRFGNREKAQETITNGLKLYEDNPILNTLYYSNMIKNGSPSMLNKARLKLSELAEIYPRNGYILQKLVNISALQGDLPWVITKLNKINWQVEPAYLEQPVRIAVSLAQKNYRQALSIADSLPKGAEHVEAIIRKIFLSWAASEQSIDKQKEIAGLGLRRDIAENCYKNVPFLTMCAQLACMAGENEKFDQIFSLIFDLNPEAAEEFRNVEKPFESWEDFEPEMP